MPCFQYIQPYWEKADYVLANLETTLSDRNFSGYPQFCAPWQLARDIKQSGVDILTTNNNHSCDKGENGIRKTIYYLDYLEIPHIGTYTDTSSWLSQFLYSSIMDNSTLLSLKFYLRNQWHTSNPRAGCFP
ncbi:MAG: CapA family protein [Odoribacter sp.]